MKKSIQQVAAIGVAVMAAGLPVWAQDSADNLRAGEPYVGAEVGPAFQQNLYIRDAGRTVGLDAGVRGDVSAGFNLADQVAVEVETGAIDNRIRSEGTTIFGGNRAYLDQVPLMGNIIFRAPLLYGITPYIGGGAGGMVSQLSVRTFDHWTSDADVTFAYQGMAGVNVALNRHMDVGLGYHFIGTMDHVWFADDPTMYTPTGKTLTHAVVATFTFSF
jgi:opacity protein-like surface antigen